ncbi:hypothetical protein QQF64_020356 [Cirrhinus molitorella]|uniref:Uncharacterized protein n=1 Tax=Cirrhinus molitorella TaxID=172907 RepID=A0ABR3L8Y1_9TELE
MFESTAEGWPPNDWVQALAPLLTGEAQRAYFTLPAEVRDQYEAVKTEVLVRMGLSQMWRFCQTCPTCQVTSPRTPPPSPLIALPIFEVPFERIGMDLVGQLPKSARGHEHILVIVDYATRYPEAIPLRKATAKAITLEHFLLQPSRHPQGDLD